MLNKNISYFPQSNSPKENPWVIKINTSRCKDNKLQFFFIVF